MSVHIKLECPVTFPTCLDLGDSGDPEHVRRLWGILGPRVCRVHAVGVVLRHEYPVPLATYTCPAVPGPVNLMCPEETSVWDCDRVT